MAGVLVWNTPMNMETPREAEGLLWTAGLRLRGRTEEG
jgi:hypothetical protein